MSVSFHSGETKPSFVRCARFTETVLIQCGTKVSLVICNSSVLLCRTEKIAWEEHYVRAEIARAQSAPLSKPPPPNQTNLRLPPLQNPERARLPNSPPRHHSHDKTLRIPTHHLTHARKHAPQRRKAQYPPPITQVLLSGGVPATSDDRFTTYIIHAPTRSTRNTHLMPNSQHSFHSLSRAPLSRIPAFS